MSNNENVTITEVIKKLNDVDVLEHDGDVIGGCV